jgi:hypothetical protein
VEPLWQVPLLIQPQLPIVPREDLPAPFRQAEQVV